MERFGPITIMKAFKPTTSKRKPKVDANKRNFGLIIQGINEEKDQLSNIDKKCLYALPTMFLAFNLFYWYYVMG